MGFLGHIVVLFLFWGELPYYFLHSSLHNIIILPRVQQDSNVSTSLPTLIAFCFCLLVLFACFNSSCHTLNCVSKNVYTEALTPSTSEYDFIWRKSL